jgi:uncharacterized protein YbjT (DUF2867 family)
MFAITGITGQVGGVVARTLLAAGNDVRAVMRDHAKGEAWSAQGCEIAIADIDDTHALQRAFAGAEAVFIVPPPRFDPALDFPEARTTAAAVRDALMQARPERVVCISTVGAQALQQNLLSQLAIIEQALGDLPQPVTFLRPAWYMENAAWDIDSARSAGIVHSYLQPLDRAIPMVATADVGRIAAELLQESTSGRRIVELEGPHRYSPNDIASAFAHVLGRDVRAQAVPRATWETLFRAQGARNPLPRMRMLDGFNEGWLAFEHAARKGRVGLLEVVRVLVDR